MTIFEACEILNKHNHEGHCDWRVPAYLYANGKPVPESFYANVRRGTTDYTYIDRMDAIAFAEAYIAQTPDDPLVIGFNGIVLTAEQSAVLNELFMNAICAGFDVHKISTATIIAVLRELGFSGTVDQITRGRPDGILGADRVHSHQEEVPPSTAPVT